MTPTLSKIQLLRAPLKFLKGTQKLFLILLAGILISFFSTDVFGQDDKPSKAKKEKIRSSKRKGERTRKNPRVKETRFKMRTRKGDKAVNRDLTGRRVKRNQRSPRPQTNFSNYKPASRRSQYGSRSRNTIAPGRIRTATRKGERSRSGDISGRRIRTTQTQHSSNRIRYNAPNPYVTKGNKSREGRKTYRSTYVRSASGQNGNQRPYLNAPNPYVARNKKSRESRAGGRFSAPSIKSRTAKDARNRNASTGRKKPSPRTSTGGTSFARRSSGGIRSTQTQPGSRAKSFKGNRAKSVSGNIQNRRPVNPFAKANTKGKRRGDVANNRDITGRRVRENKRSPQKHITVNGPNPYKKRDSKGKTIASNKKQLARNARSVKPGSRFSNTSFGGVRTASRAGERSTSKSASGKNLRARNMSSRKPTFGIQRYPGYLTNTKRGEGGFTGKSARIRSSAKPGEKPGVQFGGFKTATAKGERSTNRDIAGKKIRTRNKESRTTQIVGRQQKRRLSISGGLRNNNGQSLESRPPGRGALQGGTFGGNIRASGKGSAGPGSKYSGGIRSKPTPKGGGSITRLRNNDGRALAKSKPGLGTIQGGSFGGNMKASRKGSAGPGSKYSGTIRYYPAPKGGGSITRLRNNNGRALAKDRPGRGSIQGGNYTGTLSRKSAAGAKRPQGTSFAGRIRKGPSAKPGKGTLQGGNFRGANRTRKGFYTTERNYSIRTQKDDRLHNNRGNAIGTRIVGRGTIQGAGYRGNLKKKTIGQAPGTSFHGRISRKSLRPGRDAIAGSRYSGNLRKGPITKPGRGTIQGGRFSGNQRVNKGFYTTERVYAIRTQRDERLHNNKGNPLDGRQVGRGTIQGATFKGNLRARRDNKPGKGTIAGYRNRGDLRLARNAKPGKGTIAGYKNRGDLRLPRTVKPGKGTIAGYKNRGDLRLPRTVKPGKGTIAGYKNRGDLRLAKGNKHQKAGDALRATRPWYEIGTLRADKYKGNYRYRPTSRKDQHISSSFTGFKTGNAKKENEKFFKFRIWFARLFRNETPRHMKNRGRKPRYDKGESEIWYR